MREMINPLIKPAILPVSTPIKIPNGTGQPASETVNPVITADSVITVPTDRSIPAVTMTKVTPNARTPLTAVASSIPTTFSGVAKNGLKNEKTAKMTIRAAKANNFCAALERKIGCREALKTFSALAILLLPNEPLPGRQKNFLSRPPSRCAGWLTA